MLHKVLYVACGALEVGDRELPLDDFWACDTRAKVPAWTRLLPGTMQQRSAHWKTEEPDDGSDSDSSDSSDDSSSSSSEDETVADEVKTERQGRRRGG